MRNEAMRDARSQVRELVLWLAALGAGAALGLIGGGTVATVTGFVATVYTRLFRLLAVPTVALSIAGTLATFGAQRETGRLFRCTVKWTLLTTFAAALVGLVLYIIVAPATMPVDTLEAGAAGTGMAGASYYDYIVSVIPDNILRPLLEGNVFAILLLAAAVGIALSRMPDGERKSVVTSGLLGLQELLFSLIRALIWTLPVGIVAFAAQLVMQMDSGSMMSSLGKYVAVIVAGNAAQFFVVLPLFLLARGINPIRTLWRMLPAVLMALFTKSSAATLPVTMETAERRLGVSPRVSRFVLPICTTVNMNGCAAFILVTSLFVMHYGGMELSLPMTLLWTVVSVLVAVGNAGVPMGCYFLTLSLMSGIGAPIEIMGLILPVYTILDMIETAENVWSDSCVCAMTDKDFSAKNQ